MSSSQWLDVAVLAVAFIAAVSGWRSGALGSLLGRATRARMLCAKRVVSADGSNSCERIRMSM